MRRYDIVLLILLILSIIDFALAAPVSVQEKCQECVDVVHKPKDEITVLGKRLVEDLEKLGEYFETEGKAVESSSSAPSGPDHGLTNVVQPPAPNPASSTANPDTSKESSGCWGNCFGVSWSDVWNSLEDKLRDHALHGPQYSPMPFGSGWGASDFVWYPPKQMMNPNPNLKPLVDPSADPDFDWEHWINAPDRPSPPAKESGQANMYKVDPLSPPSTSGHAPSPPLAEPEHEVVTPSTPSSDMGSPKEPEDDVVPGPPPSADPEIHLDDQSLGTGSQLSDLQAAIYATKGKAKESRHTSGAVGMLGMRPRGVAAR